MATAQYAARNQCVSAELFNAAEIGTTYQAVTVQGQVKLINEGDQLFTVKDGDWVVWPAPMIPGGVSAFTVMDAATFTDTYIGVQFDAALSAKVPPVQPIGG